MAALCTQATRRALCKNLLGHKTPQGNSLLATRNPPGGRTLPLLQSHEPPGSRRCRRRRSCRRWRPLALSPPLPSAAGGAAITLIIAEYDTTAALPYGTLGGGPPAIVVIGELHCVVAIAGVTAICRTRHPPPPGSGATVTCNNQTCRSQERC